MTKQRCILNLMVKQRCILNRMVSDYSESPLSVTSIRYDLLVNLQGHHPVIFENLEH